MISFFPVDGSWGNWSASECSVTCGQGHQVLRRECDNPPQSDGGSECEGEAELVQTCENPSCPGFRCFFSHT